MVIHVQTKETIMKKTYINPTMTVVKLNHRPLLQSASMQLRGGSATEWGAPELNDFDDFDE